MKLLVVTEALIIVVGMGTTAAAVTLELSPSTVHEVNVTTDSSPGWIPTTEQRHRAMKTIEVYLDALEGGRYAEAYGMHAEVNKRNETLGHIPIKWIPESGLP